MDSFERAGLTFDVRDGGPAQGKPVILLHGFPQDASCWDEVTPYLHRAGLRTLAPTQRGYTPGATPKDRSGYRMRELVADVLALADAAGLNHFHLVGHDWGAAVGWAAAMRHPHRVSTLTALSTPHPRAFNWAMTHGDQMLRSWYMTVFQLPAMPERLLAPRVSEFLTRSGLPEDDAARYADRFATPGSLTGPIGWYRAMPAPTFGVRRGVRRALAGLRGVSPGPRESPSPDHLVIVPTTYVWGRDDVALGRSAAERTGRYVKSDYRFVELAAGHWLPETVPARVASEIVDRVRRNPWSEPPE